MNKESYISKSNLKSTRMTNTITSRQQSDRKSNQFLLIEHELQQQTPQRNVITSNQVSSFLTEYNIPRTEQVHSILKSVNDEYQNAKYLVVKDSKAAQQYTKQNVIYDNQQNYERLQYNTKLESVHDVNHRYLLHEVHHLDRKLKMDTVDNITMKWQAKMIMLEREIGNLKRRLELGQGNQQKRIITVNNDSKLNDVESEIMKLAQQLDQKNQMIDELQNQESQFEQQLEDAENSENIKNGEQEIAIWKKKFSELNKKFHDTQEDLMMKQAEIESFKNKKTIVQKSTTESKTIQKLTGQAF